MRQLGGSDMWMQHNKVTNLRIAAACTNGLVLRPGETFPFCRTVGKASVSRGFVDGMLLSNGKAMSGVGGGICQLANLLYWMVMHSSLTVVERSEHGFDPLPDNNRVIPWGSGAAIYYNYVDLVFRNDTDSTFQFVTRVGDRYLEGSCGPTSSRPTPTRCTPATTSSSSTRAGTSAATSSGAPSSTAAPATTCVRSGSSGTWHW